MRKFLGLMVVLTMLSAEEGCDITNDPRFPHFVSGATSAPPAAPGPDTPCSDVSASNCKEGQWALYPPNVDAPNSPYGVSAPNTWIFEAALSNPADPGVIAVIDSGVGVNIASGEHEDLDIAINHLDPIDGIDNDDDSYTDNHRGARFEEGYQPGGDT
jgi:hypothetical protein